MDKVIWLCGGGDVPLCCSKRECRTGGDQRSAGGIRGRLFGPHPKRERAKYKGTPYFPYKQIYFCGGYSVSSCIMKIYLKTKTETLTTPQIRKIVDECIKWCEKEIGDKPSRKRTFKYKVLTLPDGYTPAYGMYHYDKNTLYVFRNYAVDVKMVVRAVLHEYTHFMQNLRYYGTTLAKVGYDKHPLERQARVMEFFYGYCWKHIKNKI